MKKILLSIAVILPLIFMSCTNKVVDENKPKEEINITENNDENNEIEEEKPIKNKGEPKENVETEADPSENVEVISPIEPFIDSRFGYLESIYLENDDYCLALDEAEIFFDEEAINESSLDNKSLNYSKDENGGPFTNDSYYIRNNYSTLSYFKIDKDAKFYLCGFQFKEAGGFNLFEVPLEKFIEAGTSLYNPVNPSIRPRITIWADIQDGIAIKLYQQFLP